ncbi:hypothetical protein SAMN02745945_01699 [Peptoclostridium litorale DSM 5388]|uniref:Cell division protein FtsL n=1 Tax=Peptoclostridium litorale DSM 5388 TaxID=1121324 RepID=A0A069RG81_PEPLI|nr:hypothetical protein [Peptoclostridium litorale]KDR96026.1 hypothetical protein CLIT_5c00370 [Peptoclostridium litorale DSM 5388]SIO06349.1 hypothetical protein SAMN02745945_01699 [Peptoclostridium litorale DSM 5388]
MKSLKRLLQKPFFKENITLHFYSTRGQLKTLRLNQIVSFSLIFVLLCAAINMGSFYFHMKREYSNMKFEYTIAVDRCSDLENENALLKNDLDVLAKQLQSAEEDMDEMIIYRNNLEKSSFIKSILK